MSNIRGIPGEINVNGNVYKGTETKSATVKVNNFTKEISVNVKDNYLHEKLETKQDQLLLLQNVTVSNWVADTTYADFPYKGSIFNDKIKSSTVMYVIFNLADATSGIYCPVCNTEDGVLYIYSKNSNSVTIPTIKEI